MAQTTTRKKKTTTTRKKKTATKRSTPAAKKKTARKTTTAKKRAGVSARKKKTTSKSSSKTTRRAAPPTTPPSMPSDGFQVNGVAVVTSDGKAPGARGAQGYVEGDRIKPLKFLQDLRSGGVGEISELARSIRAEGIIEPLVVRPAGDGESFELIAGERRYTAAKRIGGRVWHNIPVIIRTDLVEDDDRAVAIAIAENSPDGRSNLNVVDIGRQALKLKKKKWTDEHIAKSFGLHTRTLRRAIQVMDTSPAIQQKVQKGELSMGAAIEFTRLPEQVQKKMESRVTSSTTEQDIRRHRKQIEAEQNKTQVAKKGALSSKKTTKGKERTLTTAWKSPSDKKAKLATMCASFHGADIGDVGTTEWHELRGAIAYALWDRGDLQSPNVPSVHLEEMTNPEEDKKVNALFSAVVGNEAARYAEARKKSRAK